METKFVFCQSHMRKHCVFLMQIRHEAVHNGAFSDLLNFSYVSKGLDTIEHFIRQICDFSANGSQVMIES